MARKKKQPRWPDYDVVDMPDVVTFGTVIFIRKDKRAIRISFPAGQWMTFAPQDEIAALKNQRPTLKDKAGHTRETHYS